MIEKQRIEKFEKKYFDAFLNRIQEVQNNQFDLIQEIKKDAIHIGQLDVDIPNSSVTVRNKILDLSHVFEECGISMFVSPLEEYDMVGSSFLGDAIIFDLFDKLADSKCKLNEYNDEVQKIKRRKESQKLQLQKYNSKHKLWSKIKSLFRPVKQNDTPLTDDDKMVLNDALDEYKDVNQEIWKYSLEKNLVEAITKKIAGPQKLGDFVIDHRYRAHDVPTLVKKCVEPDLNKLKLGHLLPKLKNELLKAYNDDYSTKELKEGWKISEKTELIKENPNKQYEEKKTFKKSMEEDFQL